MAKKPKKASKKSQKSVYLDDGLWKKIDKIALDQERSANFVIEKVLEREFSN